MVRWLANLRLIRRDWVRRDRVGGLQLTDAGRNAARNLVRAHRLWESYLDTHFDLPRDHLHDAAERMEHFLDPQLQEELAAEMADRAVDPHGKTIPPPANGVLTCGYSAAGTGGAGRNDGRLLVRTVSSEIEPVARSGTGKAQPGAAWRTAGRAGRRDRALARPLPR